MIFRVRLRIPAVLEETCTDVVDGSGASLALVVVVVELFASGVGVIPDGEQNKQADRDKRLGEDAADDTLVLSVA